MNISFRFQGLSMRVLVLVATGVFLVTGLHAAAAGPEEQAKLGPATLEIVKPDEQTSQARIGDKVVAQDYYVHIEQTFSAGGRGSAVLSISNGGNGCAALYEIVRVDAAGTIAATDRFGTCSDLAEIAGDAESITVRFAPIGGTDGQLYRWTAAKGLVAAEPLAFAPKPGTGWAEAGDLVGQHPSTLFDNAAIYAALHTLLGRDYPLLLDRLVVADNLESAGGMITGSGCMAHACNTDDAFVGIDPSKQQLYVAIRQAGKAERFYPAVAKWPAALRKQRKAWETNQ
jgi:hypothetical protein